MPKQPVCVDCEMRDHVMIRTQKKGEKPIWRCHYCQRKHDAARKAACAEAPASV